VDLRPWMGLIMTFLSIFFAAHMMCAPGAHCTAAARCPVMSPFDICVRRSCGWFLIGSTRSVHLRSLTTSMREEVRVSDTVPKTQVLYNKS
jgi:hypothetical protein